MRKSMFAAVIVAVALPSFASAGEPVPMTDSDLDNVAAGLSLKELQILTADQILAHPDYSATSGAAIARYNSLNESQKGSVRDQVRALIVGANLSSGDHAKLRAITPKELQHLLPTQ